MVAINELKVAIAQLNCMVGDIAGNAAQIISQAKLAKESGRKLANYA